MILLDRLDFIGLCKEEYLLLKAVVLANSDCSMEDNTATEHLRESLLSALQDAIQCVRSTNTNLQLEKLLLILPCLRHVDTLIRMFWARIKQVRKRDDHHQEFSLIIAGGTSYNEQAAD